MKDVFKVLFENIIDTIVISYLVIVSLILIAIAFVLYPIKGIRFFIGEQVGKIVDVIDYFFEDIEEW